MKPNNLIHEKSPYLLQHAYNPVNWYPWEEKAFKRAKIEDKPIFLSIGYSTCHWCHVMEKESFEDIEVAKLLNDTFICIKVDREERPDIDKIYMKFCQMLTGSGGWPLTIIMTPDKKPFFAATYIPKQDKYGRIGMLNLIPQIKKLWVNNRSQVFKASDEITKHFSHQNLVKFEGMLDKSIFDLAFDKLFQIFDMTNGGFGSFPKFPTMHHLYFLLRYYKRTKNEFALHMVEKTINAIRNGGIWDHIGFGIHRYSTDEKWIIPHFEKMLYDQAAFSIACIEAYQLTRNNKYKRIADEIFTYILRDMTSNNGGFYSAEDADSEGIEGKFYTWTVDEIKKIFPQKEAELLIDIFNINTINIESGSILYINRSLEDIASKLNLTFKELDKFLKSSIEKMFLIRSKRIRPFKDYKILTDWNGLAISALATGARVLENHIYKKAAIKAADFIINNLITKEGSLLHRYADGQSAIDANLDDYAFFIAGLIELYQTTFKPLYLKTAIDLNKYLLENFWDNKYGGFYFTKINSDLDIYRQKDIYDGAIPSGNSIALLNLVKLSRFTADTSYEDKANQIVKAFSVAVKDNPIAYTQFISSYDFLIGPSFEVVIVGNSDSKDTNKILNSINSIFCPNKIIVLKPPENINNNINTISEIKELIPYISDMKMINKKPTIYICSNFSCKKPTNEISVALKLLTEN